MENNGQNPRQNAPMPPAHTGYQPTAPMAQQHAAANVQNTAAFTPPVAAAQPVNPVPPTHQAKQKSGGAKTFLLAFLGAAAACVIVGLCFTAFNGGKTVATGNSVTLGSDTNTTITASDSGDEDRAEAVADKALPSVVAIDVYQKASAYSNYFGGTSSNSSSSSLTYTGLGSGVILSSDGYILTNYHVVENSDKLVVTANGVEYDATIVGTDSTSDLAVIKIDAPDLTPIEIGSSSSLKAGQWVMTVGSPFGLEQSVASGIVSATSRTVVVSDSSSSSSQYYSTATSQSVYPNMIQTDAAINPGNSGGALVDQNGKLVGINAVVESYSGNYAGVGFAIPADYAMNIAQQIISGKTPTHAQMGVATTTITSSIAQRYNLSVQSGAYVSSVYADSGAESAGLQQADIITKINDTKIDSATDLTAAIRSKNVGDTVSVTYVRDGETKTVDVKLGSDAATASGIGSSSSKQSSSSTSSLYGTGAGSTTNSTGTLSDYTVTADVDEGTQAAA